MTHEEVLNLLLSNACCNNTDIVGVNSYAIDLHCCSYVIEARPMQLPIRQSGAVFKYEILSVKEVATRTGTVAMTLHEPKLEGREVVHARQGGQLLCRGRLEAYEQMIDIDERHDPFGREDLPYTPLRYVTCIGCLEGLKKHPDLTFDETLSSGSGVKLDGTKEVSVQPEWCRSLPLQQQSVLLLASRGPDGIAKFHPSKVIQRAYRATVFMAARYGRMLKFGEKADTFMSLEIFGSDAAWKQAVKEHFDHQDDLPHHLSCT